MAQTGIRERHARSCPSRTGASCRCKPTYEANVWSRRENKRLTKTFDTHSGAIELRSSYVENEADLSISVLDPTTLTVVNKIALGYRPGSVAPASNGEVWVSNPTASTVEVRDANGALTNTIPAALGACSIVFSPDGTHAYVTNEYDDSVSVINRTTKAFEARGCRAS